MSEPAQRRHVLAPFLARAEMHTPPACGVAIEVLPYQGYLNLRGDPNDSGFLEAVREALGQPLPVAANTFTQGACRVFWLGPDEWLVMTGPGMEEPSAGEREGASLARKEPLAREREGAPLAREQALATRLADALPGRACALTDLTGGQICIRLSGGNARDALAKGCTLDFHPRVFRPGQCAQTVLGKASMLICLFRTGPDPAGSGDRIAEGDSGPAGDGEFFDIVVRRTFAEYAAEWLYRSAEEYGVRVDCHG